MVANIVQLAMRGFQFLWTLLIMAISGDMIANAVAGNPSSVNYAMFVSVIAMLSLFYLIPSSIKESLVIHPIISIALDAINTLFFLCGGIAFAALLQVHSCSDAKYTKHNEITNGAVDTHKRCQEAQAVTAFLWFGFVAFAVSAVLDGVLSRGSVNVRGRK